MSDKDGVRYSRARSILQGGTMSAYRIWLENPMTKVFEKSTQVFGSMTEAECFCMKLEIPNKVVIE